MQQRIDSLAQQVEHNTFNVGVLGSSPRRITWKIRELLLSDSLFLCLFYAGLHGSVKPGQRKNLRDLLFRHKF